MTRKSKVIKMLAGVLLSGAPGMAAEVGMFSYHGSLSVSGQPASGSYDFRFVLSEDEVGGTWSSPPSTNLAVLVTNGSFSTQVEFATMEFDGTPRWLDVAVRTNGDTGIFTSLNPRQLISLAPHSGYAIRSGTASLATMATSLAGGGANLSLVPAEKLFGTVPLRAISGLTSNQFDSATDAAYRRNDGQRGFITPFDCGAKGNGYTDDTAALQTWLDRACREDLIAFLPPAPGGFYKITDTLYASNAVTIIGAGGAKHSTSYPKTRCMIKQFTAGKHGLVLLSANDSVRLQSIAIVAEPPENWQTDCYGVWFTGGAIDADCSIMEQCLVMNFGIGVMAASQADSTFRQCSFGYNGTGMQISGVANNISVDSCQMSYNRVRQLDVQSGTKLIVQNTDFAAGADGTRSAQGLFCNGQDVTMLGCRFEDYTTNACLIASSTSKLTLINTSFLNFSSAARYSLLLTNSHVVLLHCGLACIGPRGTPIFSSTWGQSSVLSLPPVQEWISIGVAGYVNTASWIPSGRALWTGSGPGPGGIGRQGWARPGSLEWGWGEGPFQTDHSLWAFGNMGGAGYQGLQAVDLLSFAKQQRSGLHGNGINLTNLSGTNIRPGTISATQMDPETDALYRSENAITNHQSTTVRLDAGLVVKGDLQIGSASLVVSTNAAPQSTTPKAWLEIKTADGQTWKIGLSQ